MTWGPCSATLRNDLEKSWRRINRQCNSLQEVAYYKQSSNVSGIDKVLFPSIMRRVDVSTSIADVSWRHQGIVDQDKNKPARLNEARPYHVVASQQ